MNRFMRSLLFLGTLLSIWGQQCLLGSIQPISNFESWFILNSQFRPDWGSPFLLIGAILAGLCMRNPTGLSAASRPSSTKVADSNLELKSSHFLLLSTVLIPTLLSFLVRTSLLPSSLIGFGWILSMCLPFLVLASRSPHTSRGPDVSLTRREALIDASLLILLCAIVFGFRLESLPLQIVGDEGLVAMELQRLGAQNPIPLVGLGWGDIALLAYTPGAYATSISDSLWMRRLPSVIFGTVTILTVYWLGRVLSGRILALVAASTVAFSHSFLFFARAALLNVDACAAISLSFALFLVGRARSSGLLLIAAGIAAGISFQMYSAGKVALLIILASIALDVIASPRLWKPTASVLLHVIVGFVCALGPNLAGHAMQTGPVSSRFLDVWVFSQGNINHLRGAFGLSPESSSAAVLLEHFSRALLSFNQTAEVAIFFQVGRPFVHFLLGPFFLIGLVFGLRNISSREWRDTYVWLLLVFLLGGLLTNGVPVAPRLLALLGPFALITGNAIIAITGNLLGTLTWARIVRPLMVGALLFAYASFNAEILSKAANSKVDAPTILGRFVASLPAESSIRLCSLFELEGHSVVQSLRGQREVTAIEPDALLAQSTEEFDWGVAPIESEECKSALTSRGCHANGVLLQAEGLPLYYVCKRG